ncbi:Alpha/Beta hydrolase protein [Leucosporidium creatinivorum]|uniref:Alpha/Beta hydrolase protein n=1 Tax=Leucosporidium creatinivorum TaxID=106004 RepID=A0A1Y2G0I1_9BASI|nr:Alpha/Beta hydrolase protein [Leucosporidium creatinivorum]
MPRIPYQNPAAGTHAIGDAIRVRRGARGLTPLDQTLLNAPEIANGWNTLLGAVRTKNSLPDDVRELMILRVAARNSATFEWIHHAHVGEDAGLTAPQLTIIRDLHTPLPTPAAPAPLSAFQAAALRFADASTFSVNVPQARIDELKTYLQNDQQLLEATAVVATYNMVSRLLVTLDVGDMGDVSVPLPETTQEEHDVEVEEGVKINVRVAKRSDSAPWLVFVNSLMTNQKMWDGVLPRLSKKYNLITFDQRGHGKSSVPPKPCTLPILASDIAKILSALSIATPIHAVIGVSQGGATTLAFAHGHPDLFSRLIACDTQATSPAANAKAWDERIALARAQGMTPLADVTVPRWFPAGSEFIAGGRREAFVHDMVTGTEVEGFAAGAAALQGYDVLPGLAEKLQGKKVLLVAGERDGALPGVLKGLKETLEKDGVDVGFEVIPGAGHLPMIDGAQVWLDIVEKFLE